MMMLTGCEGADLYNVGAPSWLDEKLSSQSDEEEGGEQEELENMMEDVYDIGNLNFNAPFFTLGKTYVVPAGQKWNAQFNLTVNPDNKYFKNFYIVLNAYDETKTNFLGDEFGVIRFDNDPSKNSEWNTVGSEIDRSLVSGNFNNSSPTEGDNQDIDASVQKMNGLITLTVDRTDGGLNIKMTNGTLTKTYKQSTSFPSTGSDVNIVCRIGVEGSYVGFLSTNIEPIGGCTEAGDKQPVSMVLKGVPAKVLVGTDQETLLAGVTAEVTFEGLPAPVSVPAEDLEFQIIPDLTNLGAKTLVAAYSKTYKGEGAAKPIIAHATFNVVDKMYTCVGLTDNTTPWWTAFSDDIKVGSNETFVSTFTNYTNGEKSWNNFLVILRKADKSEYAVMRADNYGWGAGYEGIATAATEEGRNADTWLAAMDGAKVTTYVTNNGDGTADVKAVMIGNDGNTYTQTYTGIGGIDPNDFYFCFTVEGAHLEFDNVLGEEDNTTGWWVAHSADITVPQGKTYTTRFKNYTNGEKSWNNFLVVLTKADNSEYAVMRADNYGWGTSYEGIATAATEEGRNADAWLAAMDGATVTVSVTNNGSSADVKCVMVGNDGNTYTQSYTGISPIEADNFRFRFTCEGSHLVFE